MRAKREANYPPQNEQRVVRDICDSIANYPTLIPRIDVYTSDKGHSQKLVMLRGTIPIAYRGATYNIPVQVVVMSYHPSGPPIMYVKPTANMEVKPRHDHVDRSGLVYMPYLANWDVQRSSLTRAIAAMSDVFSRVPPVYSCARPSTEQSQAERTRLVAILSGKARERLREVSDEATNEFAQLLQRRDEATESVALDDPDAERARRVNEVEAKIDTLTKEQEQLTAYIEKNRVRDGDIDVDTMIHPRDLHSEQVLECLSKDAALIDALDQLQDAVVARRIDLDTFSRETSRLARDQFYARALLRKVKLQQAHMQQVKRQPA